MTVARSSHEVLQNAKTIAVVGASRDPNKAGGSVPAGLQGRGFRAIPIKPDAETLFCAEGYPSRPDRPPKNDLLRAFPPAPRAPAIARPAAAPPAQAFWLPR